MDLNRKTAAALAAGLGALCLVAGVALIYVPAALIVAGVLLVAVGLLPDWENPA